MERGGIVGGLEIAGGGFAKHSLPRLAEESCRPLKTS